MKVSVRRDGLPVRHRHILLRQGQAADLSAPWPCPHDLRPHGAGFFDGTGVTHPYMDLGQQLKRAGGYVTSMRTPLPFHRHHSQERHHQIAAGRLDIHPCLRVMQQAVRRLMTCLNAYQVRPSVIAFARLG